MIVLRPLRWLGALSAATFRGRGERRPTPVSALPFRAISPSAARRARPAADPELSGEDASAATVVEQLPDIASRLRLRPDYDEQFLDHLFGEVEAKFGRLVRRIVRRARRPLGWYAYVPTPGGVARLLHMAAREREGSAVLDDLLEQARGEGAAVVAGRHDPHLTEALYGRLPVLGFARRPVLHSHDPEILAALSSGDSLLTQLDGEWFFT
jgi:hypothetical protein